MKKEVLLRSRLAYFQLGQAIEQYILVSDALKLSESQYKDIKLNVKAGSKSRKDELMAHQEVLFRKQQLNQAQADYEIALNNLSLITGISYDMQNTLKIDTQDTLYKQFANYKNSEFWDSHPNIQSINEISQSYMLASKARMSNLGARITITAKSSRDYPNGPTLEEFNQNIIGANVSFPLFESGNSRNAAKENKYLSKSFKEKKEQALKNLKNQWEKIKIQIDTLEDQKLLSAQAVKESKELTNMTYNAYKAGAATFLEVQNANYRFLESKINLSQINFRLLSNLAYMASMSKEE
ncbi:TolC family protein [Elusimicrobiota bacterium]